MAIIKLTPTFESQWQDLVRLGEEAGLEGQALNEIADTWDMIQVWRDWFECGYGKLEAIHHRSAGDDPPDLEVVFSSTVVPFEHTRLLPYPLGWAEDLKRTVFSDVCSNVPSLAKLPANRQELIAIMGRVEGEWSDVQDEWIALAKSLVAAIRKKVEALPNGGVIGIANRATFSDHATQFLAQLAGDFVGSDQGQKFASHTFVLHTRWNPLQFHSALIRRGEKVLTQLSRVQDNNRPR
jgi:hypothetical protein